MTIVENLVEKPSFLIIDFKDSYEVLYVTIIFDLYTFGYEPTVCFTFSAEMHFVSLFFLNERNIRTPLLMIHLLHKKKKLSIKDFFSKSDHLQTKSAGNCAFGHIYWRNP